MRREGRFREADPVADEKLTGDGYEAMSAAEANHGMLHRGEIVTDDDRIAVCIDGVIGEGR